MNSCTICADLGDLEVEFYWEGNRIAQCGLKTTGSFVNSQDKQTKTLFITHPHPGIFQLQSKISKKK